MHPLFINKTKEEVNKIVTQFHSEDEDYIKILENYIPVLKLNLEEASSENIPKIERFISSL